MKFLPKNFTKMYKFWIKTVVLYPKMYIWSQKNKKFVLFTLKWSFCQKISLKVQILDKKCSFVLKNVHLVLKKQKIVLFTLKKKFLSKNFTKMYKFWIKTVVFYPKMYIWSWKTKRIVIFTLKMKFLPKNFRKKYKFWIKTVVLYLKMYIWSWKNKTFVLFTIKMKFLPNNFTKMYKFWIKM